MVANNPSHLPPTRQHQTKQLYLLNKERVSKAGSKEDMRKQICLSWRTPIRDAINNSKSKTFPRNVFF